MNIIMPFPESSPGLRKYLHAIYSYMAVAVAVTGATAYLVSHSSVFLNTMYVMQEGTPVSMKFAAWVVMLAPLALILLINFQVTRFSFRTLRACLWVYAILTGLSLSVIFLTYTDASIAQAFFIAGGMFALMSFYGHSTQHDLSTFGAMLFMALVGLMLAMVVNIWMHSFGFQMVISVVAVLIFVGLTAYDTQKLKRLYFEGAQQDAFGGKLVVMGALTLYLDMLNLFLNLLTLTGRRRR